MQVTDQEARDLLSLLEGRVIPHLDDLFTRRINTRFELDFLMRRAFTSTKPEDFVDFAHRAVRSLSGWEAVREWLQPMDRQLNLLQEQLPVVRLQELVERQVAAVTEFTNADLTKNILSQHPYAPVG